MASIGPRMRSAAQVMQEEEFEEDEAILEQGDKDSMMCATLILVCRTFPADGGHGLACKCWCMFRGAHLHAYQHSQQMLRSPRPSKWQVFLHPCREPRHAMG